MINYQVTICTAYGIIHTNVMARNIADAANKMNNACPSAFYIIVE